jgi:hypothetical protein
MPLYHEDMHKHIQAAMDELGITVYHNERLEDMDALERLRDEAVRTETEDARKGGNKPRKGRKMIRVRLRSDREVESDLQVSLTCCHVAFPPVLIFICIRSYVSDNITTTNSSRAKSRVY